MPLLKCPIGGCEWEYTSELGDIQSIEIIKMHFGACHGNAVTPQSSQCKAPRLIRPIVDVGITQEEWNMFVVRWNQFRIGSCISNESASLQLFHCASEELGTLVLQTNPHITNESENQVMLIMESFAVIRVSKGAQRAELMKLTQGGDEAIRTFAARAQGKAQTCGFKTTGKCKCGQSLEVDYTQEVIKDVIMAGIADNDIQTSVLEIEGIESKPLNELIAIIERKERARKAYRPVDVSLVSEYKKNKRVEKPAKTQPDRSRKIPCPECKQLFRTFNGKNVVPFKICFNCFKKHKGNKLTATVECEDVCNDEVLCSSLTMMGNNIVQVDGHEEGHRGHPIVTFQLKPDFEDKLVKVNAVADTGAQTNLWSMDEFIKAGLNLNKLQKVSVRISAANKQAIDVVGGFRAEFIGYSPAGKKISCKSMVYVSRMVSGFFLSFNTMIKMLVVDKSFPTIGSCSTNSLNDDSSMGSSKPHSAALSVRALNFGCLMEGDNGDDGVGACNCPQRSAVPMKPTVLPFAPVPENIERMKEWLLERYASSTFNTCPHRPLQQMTGPPVEIHVDESAEPRVCHKPAPIPLHWQQQVKDDLLRDEALGVIERVPYGVPSTWCHRMVVTRKHDGSPRRTVDLSPLNKFCQRETFPSESPFNLARRVPANTWKTCTDAWNGYHSVPLRESDRHLTTFVTPFGRWRYTRTPQGFLSSGDGYNRRFDAILSDFKQKERCIDDTLHYDTDLSGHWWRTIEFLSLVGSSGIVLNPEKFQFCQKRVDFAGFRISSEGITPLPKYTDAIGNFPTPRNRTDVKSWFGLVNQVSNYSQLRDLMAPFRPLLSPKVQFVWSDALDIAFKRSRQLIVDQIREGVQIFDLHKQTCLRPDWSKMGLGYFLMQKHCLCPEITPDCCLSGWKITLAGSRFLTGSEERYAAVEGEALAIAWALEQTRYFTMGCSNLLVVTDHKPLVRIFGDRTLDEITNTRLFRLKQRTLPWKFTIKYLAGKSNKAADAASRHPTGVEVNSLSVEDVYEQINIVSICSNLADVTTLTWNQVVAETSNDKVLSELLTAIEEEFGGSYPLCNSFVRYKDSLYNENGAVILNDRVVVPESLRKTVLSDLHSAHQGVSTMIRRAQTIVFWPGMCVDIQTVRSNCSECNRNAPSQPVMPAQEASLPLTPFEQIFADFFYFAGHSYLIVGDRMSGWSEIFSTPSGTSKSGARGLINCLRRMFAIFGVPAVLSSDGGPEFAAAMTEDFLKKWGVQHRISSAYNPQSNGRAEVAVKSAKRLLRRNINQSGSLDSDILLRAMLALRNTPDADCQISPAQIIFGRPLRDAMQFSMHLRKFSYPSFSRRWREAWDLKDNALRTRYVRNTENLNRHSRLLPALQVGDRCLIQNRHGNNPKKWDSTGRVMKVLPYDKYEIVVDGSRRLTTRNRRFLKLYTPVSEGTVVMYPEDGVRGDRDTDVDLSRQFSNDDDVCPDQNMVLEPDPIDEETTDVPGSSGVVPEATESAEAMSPPSSNPKKVPLALRRLREHNQDGVKQLMRNPSSRRPSNGK